MTADFFSFAAHGNKHLSRCVCGGNEENSQADHNQYTGYQRYWQILKQCKDTAGAVLKNRFGDKAIAVLAHF